MHKCWNYTGSSVAAERSHQITAGNDSGYYDNWGQTSHGGNWSAADGDAGFHALAVNLNHHSASAAAESDLFNITNDCAMFDFALYTIAVGLMVALGVAGNGLSFIVLRVRESGSSGSGSVLGGRITGSGGGGSATTSFLLRALAAADTAVLLAAVPLYVLPPIYPMTGYLKEYYGTYIIIMPILWPVYLVPFTISVFITVLVSVDRYLAVCRPFGGRDGQRGNRKSIVSFGSFGGPLTVARSRYIVGIVVAVAVVYNVPRFFEYQQVEVCVGVNQSRRVFEIGEFGEHLFYRIIYANVMYFLFVHGGPLVALSFLNFRLVQALRMRSQRRLALKNVPTQSLAGRSNGDLSSTMMVPSMRVPSEAGSRTMSTNTTSGGGGGGSRHQRDVTLTLIGVICVFIVCQTPTLVDHVLWTAVDKELRQCGGWHYFYTAVGDAMAVLNSSVNFGVYVLTSRRFRRGVSDALFGCCARHQNRYDGERTTCYRSDGASTVDGRRRQSVPRLRRFDTEETTCGVTTPEAIVPPTECASTPLPVSGRWRPLYGGNKVDRWQAILERAAALTSTLHAAAATVVPTAAAPAAGIADGDDCDEIILNGPAAQTDCQYVTDLSAV